ncbi:MAG: GTPase HflX [Nitrospirae bacterium 13_2_20CM_2_63_8]|nr:MAG: GTPase HflX [Nitrospirae bacterium 13_2_20CM_2_63_8]
MPSPHGNLTGLKPSQLRRLEHVYRRRVPEDAIISWELARFCTGLSREIGRQIGLLINRRGLIEDVIVGNDREVVLPDLSDYRLGRQALRGIRLIHTHLRDEPLSQDDLTDLALLRLDLIAALGVRADGQPGHLYAANILPPNPAGKSCEVWSPVAVPDCQVHLGEFLGALEEELSRTRTAHLVDDLQEQAILVSVSRQSHADQEESLAELADLARSAGLMVLDMVVQRPQALHPKYLLGSGKLKEVVIKALQHGVDYLVFDQNLSSAQATAIAAVTDLKVIDRTQLILDIFSRRAHSREGKLQVELAQLRYLLPRLTGRGTAMSRLAGGIGGRGPGETKLEVDRRRVRDRISHLEKQMEALARTRMQQRARRLRRAVPIISIVGYTNAGKSTLLNVLTRSRVTANNRLFETLDTASRRLRFPQEREAIVTDTVGFIRNLPAELMGAFRATLEELHDADLLLHVADLGSPTLERQVAAVEDILRELELDRLPRLLVLNKADLVDPTEATVVSARLGGLAVSAVRPDTLLPLLDTVEKQLWSLTQAGLSC